METKIEAKIYKALKSDETLLSKLKESEDSIFHMQAPAQENTKYPCLVYTLMSCVPFFWSDNLVQEYKASIRFHILTTDGDYESIADDVERIMVSLGAARYQSDKYRENREIVKIVDYRMRVKAEESGEIKPAPIESDIGKCDCHCKGATIEGSIISEEEIDDIIKSLED